VKKHPGGQYAIYLAKGQEGRSLIESYHMSPPAQSLLDKYRLPAEQQIETPEWKAFPPSQKFSYDEDGFFRTVKREARKYFADRKLSHKVPSMCHCAQRADAAFTAGSVDTRAHVLGQRGAYAARAVPLHQRRVIRLCRRARLPARHSRRSDHARWFGQLLMFHSLVLCADCRL
jgi:hypothetical protein